VAPGPPNAATKHDHLLTEQRILGQKFRLGASEIPGGTDPHLRRRAGWSKQARAQLGECPDQGEKLHGHGGLGWGLVDRERPQCELNGGASQAF
jgi:hypothetical protein